MCGSTTCFAEASVPHQPNSPGHIQLCNIGLTENSPENAGCNHFTTPIHVSCLTWPGLIILYMLLLEPIDAVAGVALSAYPALAAHSLKSCNRLSTA